MPALRDRLSGLACVAAALVVACSVFPEEAILPVQGSGGSESPTGGTSLGGAAPSGGTNVAPEGGDPGMPPPGGTASAGAPTGGGAGGSAGSGTSGQGGEPDGQGGGGAGTSPCDEPLSYSYRTQLDLWIGSADEDQNHGGEALLYVSAGSDERRTLFSVTLPPAPAGTVLLSAEVSLRLESNADGSGAARRLGLYLLEPRAVREDKATWVKFAQGNNDWTAPGGDLSSLLSEVNLPAGTSSGRVRFDVTEAVRSSLSDSATTYGVALLELGAAPMAPAELAFTSREGNASESAELRISYCEP